MSRIPYRALMRPQRTPPVQRPGFFPDPPAPVAAPPEPEAPVVEAPVVEEAPEPEAPVVEEPVVEEPVVEEPVVEVETPPEPVMEAVASPEPASEPVPAAPPAPPVVPKVNSASSKADLLFVAAAFGLTNISATNTRAEIWAAIQAATP